MPPEQPQLLIAIDFALREGKLVGREERVEPKTGRNIFVSWYAEEQPEGYQSVCGGLVYVRNSDITRTEVPRKSPPDFGGLYVWRDTNRQEGVMFAMVLPTGYGLSDPDPLPQEAKEFQGRLALHWAPDPGERSFEVAWRLKRIGEEPVEEEVQRIMKIIFAAKRADKTLEYDVALSYASEDKDYVEQVAAALKQKGIAVYNYRDEEERAKGWGKDLELHLRDLYSSKARYTVLFLSKHYAEKRWTKQEFEHAQASAFVSSREYVLPARFDNTELPGLLPVITYLDLRQMSPIELAETIARKVELVRI